MTQPPRPRPSSGRAPTPDAHSTRTDAPASKRTDAPASVEHSYLSYAEFGQRFFAAAVTRDRVVAATANLTGRPIEVGPLGVGPLGLVKVSASGTVGEPVVTPRESRYVAFDVLVPADLALRIDLGLEKYRFTASVRVPVAVTARAADPLLIVIDIERPTRHTIEVDLHAEGMRAGVVQTLGGVENEIKRAVARFVDRELDKPGVRESQVIDVTRSLGRISL